MAQKKVTYNCTNPICKYGVEFRKGETKPVNADLDFSNSKCFTEEKEQKSETKKKE